MRTTYDKRLATQKEWIDSGKKTDEVYDEIVGMLEPLSSSQRVVVLGKVNAEIALHHAKLDRMGEL